MRIPLIPHNDLILLASRDLRTEARSRTKIGCYIKNSLIGAQDAATLAAGGVYPHPYL
ncbi:hypothetical protein PAXRUDRAFT_831189 [Paxillus rubicundulus Ve08.2h10]|uniref:Uncharacterized protein n=1 Tax=Paxillus rubicundulus Ve08.2h10 TaxID=930991 RepID=A0A0D0DXG6_9AGAM|nr:hypothetical protein PAXRUDRAFT_831189 [Paxillus rubicundulus Ve08.2h10]